MSRPRFHDPALEKAARKAEPALKTWARGSVSGSDHVRGCGIWRGEQCTCAQFKADRAVGKPALTNEQREWIRRADALFNEAPPIGIQVKCKLTFADLPDRTAYRGTLPARSAAKKPRGKAK